MEAISEISVKVCTYRGNRKATFYNSTRFKDGLSPMLVAKLAALTAITTMRQHITKDRHRKLWVTADDIEKGIWEITKQWEKRLWGLHWETAWRGTQHGQWTPPLKASGEERILTIGEQTQEHGKYL